MAGGGCGVGVERPCDAIGPPGLIEQLLPRMRGETTVALVLVGGGGTVEGFGAAVLKPRALVGG